MVEWIFMFNVPKERQKEFLNFVKTGTKPWTESHGCLGYNVWQAVGEDTFMKRMEFKDMAAFEKFRPLGEQNQEFKALIEKFQSYIENAVIKPYIKLT